MKKILLMNGPNLNMLGIREPGVYGNDTLEDLEAGFSEYARAHGCSILSTGRIPKSNAVALHCAEKWGFHPVREDAESVTFEKNFEYDEESCWNRLQEVIEK